MAGLYFYVPKDRVEDVVSCGLKLSEWYDREMTLSCISGKRKFLKTLLNPRDDEAKLKDPNYQCLRLEIDPQYCLVGDSVLYDLGLKDPAFMEYYKKRLTPLIDYIFGTFLIPEVLVMISVLPDYIEVPGKAMDIPVLYESSMSLYLNNELNRHEEVWDDSGNHLLYAYYIYLESRGRVVRYEDKDKGNAVFFCVDSDEYAVCKIPEEEYYIGR